MFRPELRRIGRRIQSQSVRVEPRDDAEVEGRRQKLLKACNGFRDHDDHLKLFFNTDPNPKTQSEYPPLLEKPRARGEKKVGCCLLAFSKNPTHDWHTA